MQQENVQLDFLRPEFLLKIISRRRWYIIIPLLLAMGIGSYLSITLPKIYEAQTLILVEPQRVPTNYVQSVVSSDVVDRITTLSQQILSRTNLEKVIQQFDLFSTSGQAAMYQEDMVAALRSRITIEVTQNRRETNSFTIRYRDGDPKLVMDITNTLASFFIDENLKAREAQAIGTSDFLEAELITMRERLEEKEQALKSFRESHMGELPDQLETNLRVLDRLQANLTERQESLRNAQSRLATLQSEWSAGLRADQQGAGGVSQPNPLDPDALRAELTRLEARYTDKHPDILKIKQQLQYLESRGVSSGEAQPPVREPLQVQETRREIQNIGMDIDRIKSQIARYQQRVETTPEREQALLTLQRDYQNMQASYSSLLNRKLEADISVNMERKQKGEQFRILDRARLPVRPVEPDLLRLFLITIIAGLGLGGGIVFLMEYLNTCFRSPKEVELALGLPTIAIVPFLENRKTRFLKTLNSVGTSVALVFASLMLAFFAALALHGVEETLALVSNVKHIML